MKRAITYASLLDYVEHTIAKAYKKHTTYPYLQLMINLKYLYDKYDITDDQDKRLKEYLINSLGCKEAFTHIFSVPRGYININKNEIGVIDIRRNSNEIAGLINISYSLYKKIDKDGNVPSNINIAGYISPELIDELANDGIRVYEKKSSLTYDIYINNPEEIKFANYKEGVKIMYREKAMTADPKPVNMANIINTYDVLKVQQQNVRSTKLVKGLKEIQRSIPDESFREVDVVLDIDSSVQSKINRVIMKYHMTISKKFRVDNTYQVMCNCLTTTDDIANFKSATIIHNPDNNMSGDWEAYSKMRIANNKCNNTTVDQAINEDPTDFIDDIPPVEEIRTTAEENDFDAIPSAASMKDEADKVAKDIVAQRKEIANGLRAAAKNGEYSFSTNKVVYDCIINELKDKHYNVHISNGVTTISCK